MTALRWCHRVRHDDMCDHHRRKEAEVYPPGVVPDDIDTPGPVDKGPQRFDRRRDIGCREHVGENVAQATSEECEEYERKHLAGIEPFSFDPLVDPIRKHTGH